MIFGNLRKSGTSFQFLKLKSADLAFFQFIFPSLGAIAAFAAIAMLSDWFIVDYRAMISSLNSFIGILIGFYIASLAAITSFPSETLDSEMKGKTPTLTKSVKGKRVVERLTRRRFLSILFGYCSVCSILIYIFGLLWLGIKISKYSPEFLMSVNVYLKWPFLAIYVWLCFSLITTTILALHYLIDRVHRA
ncbi:MAG: hypothetical protein V7664_04205 [Qipengyuania sp.]|uniref:hypothetical protein n=1 Tax=Qipengyuania sp. TaxID=2004515 RepID=UPI003002430A